MTTKTTVYISQPATEHGPWRVMCAGRPTEELRTRERAIARAVDYARLMESVGHTIVVKLERPDGSWVIYRG